MPQDCAVVLHVLPLGGFKKRQGFCVCVGVGYLMLTDALHYNRGEVFAVYECTCTAEGLCCTNSLPLIFIYFLFYEISKLLCNGVKCI